jgi:putative endonuclease
MYRSCILKIVTDISTLSTKELGAMGEEAAAQYLKKQGFSIVERNVVRKTGEIDLIVKKKGTLHFVEVKARMCREFPQEGSGDSAFDPSANLHNAKISKVARTSEWYVAEKGWEGDWQVDGLLVWLRSRDGAAFISYLPQIL